MECVTEKNRKGREAHHSLTPRKQKLAAGLGFEPRRAASKTAVLPLDDPATDI